MKNLVCIVTIALTCLFLFHFFPPTIYGVTKKDVWEGKLSDGTRITKDDLSRILIEHKKWIESHRKEGQRASLEGANLHRVNLEGAFLPEADLPRADLTDANLRNANLRQAGMKESILVGANLEGANLELTFVHKTNLTQANLKKSNLKYLKGNQVDLRYADLTQANLFSANLYNAKINYANFSNTYFEPSEIRKLNFLGVKGLSKIKFDNFKAVVDLRIMAKNSGLRNEERALTSALRKYRLRAAPLHERIFESYILLGWITDYGTWPWRVLGALFVLVPFFSILYMAALILPLLRKRRTGIWVVRLPERLHKGAGKEKPIKLTTNIFFRPLPSGKLGKIRVIAYRWIRIIRIGLYFSFLSAFSIGWRELNVGNWITRMQRREYILRATGWVRTVSGLQSLISVYLMAMWVLTYFGRPFE